MFTRLIFATYTTGEKILTAKFFRSTVCVHFHCPYTLQSTLFSLCRVYSGHHTFLLNPYDLDINPSLWLSVVSNNKGTPPFRTGMLCINKFCTSLPVCMGCWLMLTGCNYFFICFSVVRDTYCSYATLDICCRELGSNTDTLKVCVSRLLLYTQGFHC